MNSDGAICVPVDFSTVNQSTQQAYYYFHTVTIDSVAVDSNDWVGAFNGNVCVGARKWDTAQCGGGVCDVPVMGESNLAPWTEGYMQGSGIPSFKVFDASANAYYDAVASEDIPWGNNSLNMHDYFSILNFLNLKIC